MPWSDSDVAQLPLSTRTPIDREKGDRIPLRFRLKRRKRRRGRHDAERCRRGVRGSVAATPSGATAISTTTVPSDPQAASARAVEGDRVVCAAGVPEQTPDLEGQVEGRGQARDRDEGVHRAVGSRGREGGDEDFLSDPRESSHRSCTQIRSRGSVRSLLAVPRGSFWLNLAAVTSDVICVPASPLGVVP